MTDAAKVNSWAIPSKLRIKSRKNPDLNDKLLDCITQKITDSVNHIELPKKKRSNLTVLEADGMKWCKKAMSERRLYFSRVDKGGCILILNADDVHKIMLDTLDRDEKFEKLENDPRNEVKKKIKNAIKGYTERNLLSSDDLFAITGETAKGGWSKGHEFVVRKTNMYPLFKIHKLSLEQIAQKKIPPTRMVTSGVSRATYR